MSDCQSRCGPCPSGGSNSSRSRAWKCYLQQLSDQLDIGLVVCHYPPETSNWNLVEHRLFSFISLNWKGEPLVARNCCKFDWIDPNPERSAGEGEAGQKTQ